METVGIRELKAKLSEYIRKASSGEIVQVTDRGRVVAQLRGPGPTPEEFPFPGLLKAAAEGRVRLGVYPIPKDLYGPGPLSAPEGTAQRLLDEIREDRR